MTIQEVTERVHTLGNAWEEFKHVNDARLNEIEHKGYADPLYLEHLRKINDAIDNTKSRIDRIETVQARPGFEMSGATSLAGNSEYKAAFNNYLRKGMDAALEALQTKALSVGTDSNGGFLVPNEVAQMIVGIVNESSPMRSLATVETISSDALDLVQDPNDFAAAWGDETTDRSAVDSATPSLSRLSIATFEMYSQPKATQKLIDDGSINIEQWIAQKVGDKFARLEATSFITGDGTTMPQGILSLPAGTTFGTQIEQKTTGVSAVVTADSLIQLYYALKDEYAKRATFLMHRTTVQAVRLLKEATTNQYLWQPGLTAGTPDSLLGVPVKISADMPVPGASSLSVAVGDFKRAYLIVDRIGIRTLRDPFTAKPFVKFYTTKRVGGVVMNTDAVKILKLI